MPTVPASATQMAVISKLIRLPRKAANETEIDAWLDEFDAYIAAGRHYADALRTGDESKYTKADVEGVADFLRHRRLSLAGDG